MSMVTPTKTGKHRALGRLGTRATQLLRDPPRLVGGARNVLTWITFVLAMWLSVGALTTQLFGAFVSGGRHSSERDEDDQDASGSVQ